MSGPDLPLPARDNVPDESPGNEETRRDVLRLWTGIFAGPFAWFAHQQVSFVMVPWVCRNGEIYWLHLLTVACLAATALAGRIAWDTWKRERHKTRSEPFRPGQQRVIFMAVLGVLGCAFFAAVIVAQEIPNLFLDPCQR